MHSYELAFRMQSHAPDAIDISKETDATKKLYGVGEKPTDYFGRQLLMARRLVERGVRYVQIFSGGGNFDPSWDAHWNLKENHGLHCAETDMPMAGPDQGPEEPRHVRLDADRLARRVRPAADQRAACRAATTTTRASRCGSPAAASKAAPASGQPTSTATRAAENPKSIYELHATILHLLGLEYENLTYRFNGRDMRLTDVHGKVIREILA